MESDLVNDESDGLLAVFLFEFECHVVHASSQVLRRRGGIRCLFK